MILLSIILILLFGFFGGQIARKIGAPPLLGMIIVGILLGSEVSNLIDTEVIKLADELRTIAVIVILMRAGLGLDRDKLIKQGNVALRLGFLPAIAEMLVVAVVSIWLFQFDFITGLLLGCVVSAESPAVIVPGMLRLKNIGWGVAKGIPDAILTSSALSDVLVLLVFSLLLNFLTQSTINSNAFWLLPLQVIAQIILGIIIGYLAAKLIVWLTVDRRVTQNTVQETLVVAGLALLTVILAKEYPYFSGYLSVMTMGFFTIEFNPPLARRLRTEFNHLWIVAEIILFVLMGASIQIKVLEDVLLSGTLLLFIGLICGRTIGWYLATVASNWNWREKLFLLPGNSAKATVQAAIGAIPLSLGIPGGEIILAVAALSILITAPLGAWAIPTFAPKLLSKSPVDPTKTNITTKTIILAAIADCNSATSILTKAGDFARRSNGEIIVVHVKNNSSETEIAELQQLSDRLLLDIPHQFKLADGSIPETIISLCQEYQARYIFMGQKSNFAEKLTFSSVTFNVLKNSIASVIVVTSN